MTRRGLRIRKIFRPSSAGPQLVALQGGQDRRKNVYLALKAIDRDLRAGMKGKKDAGHEVEATLRHTETLQLAASHPDAMRGILDYLAESFRGPVKMAQILGRRDPPWLRELPLPGAHRGDRKQQTNWWT